MRWDLVLTTLGVGLTLCFVLLIWGIFWIVIQTVRFESILKIAKKYNPPEDLFAEFAKLDKGKANDNNKHER